MRSIRFSLTICFLALLALSLGSASLMAYRSASRNLEGRLSIQKELAQTTYKDRCRDEENRLDDSLLFQAQTLARLVQFHVDWGKLKHLELHALGMLTSPANPGAFVQAPVWALQSTRGFAFDLFRRATPSIRFDPAELLTRLDGQVAEFFQIDTAWNASYKSNSLEAMTMPVNMATFAPDDVLHWEYEELQLNQNLKVRRVILKASRFLLGPTLPTPQRNRFSGSNRNGERGGDRVESPSPRPSNTNTDSSFRPAIFIQCAYDIAKRDNLFASLAQQRDEDILTFANEHKKNLEEFRDMLAAINMITFLAGGGICFWLVRLGLSPLDVLTSSVSRINEKDFSLDISESKLPGELKPIASRLALTLDQLKKAFEREKQATADISHELRTPLSAMLATLDLALRKSRTVEEYREMLEDCRENCVNMRKDVERLLALARLDAGADPFKPEIFDLSQLAADCVKMITPLANSKGISMHISCEPTLEINSDPGKLKEILVNLLHNAVQYNKPGGNVFLRLAPRPGSMVIEVEDDGIGIEESKKNKIFERFFRADSSRTHGDSTNCGLGLAIVKGYAELLGAGLEVTSQPDHGSTFKLVLVTPMSHQVLTETMV